MGVSLAIRVPCDDARTKNLSLFVRINTERPNISVCYIKCLKKIEIQDVEDFEERESDSNEDEFCPECNNYVGKKGSFIKNILISKFNILSCS